MDRMPALFIGHGSPMNTLESNGYTSAWRALGPELPRPKAILVVSAHWYFGATAVTARARRTLNRIPWATVIRCDAFLSDFSLKSPFGHRSVGDHRPGAA